MGRVRSIVVAFVVLASIAGLTAQSETERDATWSTFMAWFKAVPKPSNPLVAYAGKLKADGLAESRRQGPDREAHRPARRAIGLDRGSISTRCTGGR